MSNPIQSFGKIARGLAHNPLGIIALFLVLVYGLASQVTVFAGSFTSPERLPLIYFLVFFPVLVLFVFAWLVSCHHRKLYAPSDFKDEENFVKMQMDAVASLSAATGKWQESGSDPEIGKIVKVVRSTSPVRPGRGDGWKNHILWVDDEPKNNIYERKAFEAMGLRITLAFSTKEALTKVAHEQYAAIISDMKRREGDDEGYVLLDKLRDKNNHTPVFIYGSLNAPEHKGETRKHGGQGNTNSAQELFEMITNEVIR